MLNGPVAVPSGAVVVLDAEPGQQRVGLRHADLEVVEADVEVDVLAVADEPVVGDDRDAGVGGGLQLAAERGAVDGGDDQGVGALGDHLVDLLRLGRDVVARELQVDAVALRPPAAALTASPSAIQRSEVWVGIETPIDRSSGSAPPPPPRAAAGTLATTGRQRQRQNGTGGGQAELPAHVVISSSRHLPPLDPAQARGCASGPNVSANNAPRQGLFARWLSRSRNPRRPTSAPVCRRSTTPRAPEPRSRVDESLRAPRASAQGDLAGQQAGAGAALVGGERLGHAPAPAPGGSGTPSPGSTQSSAGVSAGRSHTGTTRPRARKAPAYRVPSPSRICSGRRQPGERVEQLLLGLGPHPAQVRPLVARAAPSRRRPGRRSRTVGRIASLACSSPACAAATGVGALQPEAEVVVDGDLERRGQVEQLLQPRARRSRRRRSGPGRPAHPAGASRAAASAVPRSRLTSSDDVCIWTPSRISPFARTRAGRAAGQHAGEGHVPAVRRPQLGRGRRHELAQRHPVGLARQALEGPRHRRARSPSRGSACSGGRSRRGTGPSG